MRPLHKIGALLRALLADAPDYACEAVPDAVERLVTAEGEDAALATLDGCQHGAPAQRDVGYVFGDDFYARISAVCYRPELFESVTSLVRDLTVGDAHGLGLRRRRFDYAPPRQWQPIVRDFITDWFAPAYPRDVVWLTVHPALPAELAPSRFVDGLLGFGRQDVRVIEHRVVPLALANGLGGDLGESVCTIADRRVAKLCCVLRDHRYAYAFDATAASEDALRGHRETLESVFASTRPVPMPHVRVPAVVSPAQSFWLE
jgi:hypothetical protein